VIGEPPSKTRSEIRILQTLATVSTRVSPTPRRSGLISPGGTERTLAGTRDGYLINAGPSSLTNLGTALPVEAFPGVLYVRERMAQMYQRSAFELQPYPQPWLISAALGRAWSLVSPGVPTPSVVPSEDGNVSLIWHKGGWDIEVEFGEFGTDVWAVHRAGDQTWHGALEERSDELQELLRSMNEDAAF
jgi:hypothetical protein